DRGSYGWYLARLCMRGRTHHGAPLGTREIDPHRRASADRAFDPRGTARLLGKPVDLAETQTGAFADLLGRVERLEGSLQHIGWHAGSGIGHREQDMVAGRLIDAVTASDCQILGPKAEAAQSAHCVPRVSGEVQDRSAELDGVDF